MTIPDYAPIYDGRLDYYSPIKTVPIQKLSALVNVHDLPGPTLDVGCGTGYLAQWLTNVVGIDYSERRIELARRNHPRDEWIHADVFDWLPATDRRFASAVCVEVLEHTTDPRALINLIRAVTVGPVVATVPLGILDETHMFDWRYVGEVEAELAPHRIATYGPHAVCAWVHNG